MVFESECFPNFFSNQNIENQKAMQTDKPNKEIKKGQCLDSTDVSRKNKATSTIKNIKTKEDIKNGIKLCRGV